MRWKKRQELSLKRALEGTCELQDDRTTPVTVDVNETT